MFVSRTFTIPTATQCLGMGLVTTTPAPMVAYSPMEVWLRIDDYKLETMEPSLDSFVLRVNLRLKKQSHFLANVLNTHPLTLLGNKSWMINRWT